MKILNLYAGIGGNRKLWPKEHEVTAVESNPEIAKIYHDFFQDDDVIITDAHQYLLEYSDMFDFIWSSPPCQSHSRTNIFLNAQGKKRFPDMKLYEEILYLKRFFKGKWVVENVRSYYKPLIKPYECYRHYFWSNFIISKFSMKSNFSILNCKSDKRMDRNKYYKKLQEHLGIHLKEDIYTNHDKFSVLTNCVHPKLGLHIFNCAFKIKQHTLIER